MFTNLVEMNLANSLILHRMACGGNTHTAPTTGDFKSLLGKVAKPRTNSQYPAKPLSVLEIRKYQSRTVAQGMDSDYINNSHLYSLLVGGGL